MNRYDELMSTLPPGLDRAILRVLGYHHGRSAAIGREDLVSQVKRLGFACHERQLREMIKQLRRDGHLIGSAPGEDGGYYLISCKEEYDDFIASEFRAKIVDMEQTLRAMNISADREFGAFAQGALF